MTRSAWRARFASAFLKRNFDVQPSPFILISPDFHSRGVEFGDASQSLSFKYPQAIEACGGVPLTMTHTPSRALVNEYVSRCNGVLLTGGDDLNPGLYGARLQAGLRAKALITRDGGRRDLFELMLLEEVFRQRKPLLAICRGHQLLNVALGGTLYVDLPSQKPSKIRHGRMDRNEDVVHSVRLTRGSLLSKITRKQTLGVNSTHHQAVNRLAAALRATARSADGVIEGVEQATNGRYLPFLLSVQFHPERLMDRYPEHRAIFESFVQACIADG
jgi:putative glutamine amidotransferase